MSPLVVKGTFGLELCKKEPFACMVEIPWRISSYWDSINASWSDLEVSCELKFLPFVMRDFSWMTAVDKVWVSRGYETIWGYRSLFK